MSAIFGLFHLDGRSAAQEELERMGAHLVHRGAPSFWQAGPIGLGWCVGRDSGSSDASGPARRLSAPVSDGCIVAADARIDNRDELARNLALEQAPDRTKFERDILREAYRRWGEQAPERLVGAFAFAIWDSDRQSLFCARDFPGVRPFYYFYSGKLFAFASEIKAMLALADLDRTLDQIRIRELLTGRQPGKARTIYQNVHRLIPGTSMRVQGSGYRTQSYWTPYPAREIQFRERRAYSAAFTERFEEAVSCRLETGRRTAALLSGGLDSSSIAFTASELIHAEGNGPLMTVSAIFPGLDQPLKSIADESDYIEEALASGRFDPHLVWADTRGPLDGLDTLLSWLDEPFYYPHIYLPLTLLSGARDRGVEILLDGSDGDATVSHGLDRLTDLFRQGRWLTFYRESRALAQTTNGRMQPRRLFWRYALQPHLPRAAAGWRRHRNASRGATRASQVLEPEHVRRAGSMRVAPAHSVERGSSMEVALRTHIAAIGSAEIPYSLEILDKLAAVHGIELRYPFFDRRLVEFCLALPADQKLSQGWTRTVLREAMKGLLPEKIRTRMTKANLNPYFFSSWQQRSTALIERFWEDEIRELEGILDTRTLRANHNGGPSVGSPAMVPTVFSAIVLARWMRLERSRSRSRS